MKHISLFVIAFILCSSCGSQKSLSSEDNGELDSPLFEVINNSEPSSMRPIILHGYYKGYDGKECNFAENFCKRAPHTRSDWIFTDGIYCMYVSARNSSYLNPMRDKGKKIEIQAIVRENENKEKYLQLIKIKPIN